MQRRLSEALGRPVDPRPLALTRIGVGVAGGMIGLETWRLLIKVSAPDKLQVPAFAWLPDLSYELIWALFAVWTLLAAALTLGLRARLAAAGLALLAAVAMLLDQQVYSNHLALMAVLCGLLALGQPAAVWSLDARRRPPVAASPYWPVLLLKLQISTLYGFAALSKLNDVYLSGEVLERSTWGFVNKLGDPILIVAAVAGGRCRAVPLRRSLERTASADRVSTRALLPPADRRDVRQPAAVDPLRPPRALPIRSVPSSEAREPAGDLGRPLRILRALRGDPAPNRPARRASLRRFQRPERLRGLGRDADPGRAGRSARGRRAPSSRATTRSGWRSRCRRQPSWSHPSSGFRRSPGSAARVPAGGGGASLRPRAGQRRLACVARGAAPATAPSATIAASAAT